MTPRTYVNLRVNPNNEAEVLGQYVGTDGDVGEQLYLVASMSGNPTGRRHAAKQLAASERMLALVTEFSHDGRLQSFEDRERFRAQARNLIASCQ